MSESEKIMTVGELIKELKDFDTNRTVRIIIDSPYRPPIYPIINYIYPDSDPACSDVLIDASIPNDEKNYFK